MSMNFPSSMKRLVPYLTRAEELDAKLPIVSYYCRLYVVETLMKDRKTDGYDPKCDLVMVDLLNKCEQAKLILELQEGQVKMEEFSLGVFANADKADRESPIQPPEATLAGRFYIASLFFDVVSQFYEGELPPDLEEKRRYAKYRTLQIRNRQPLDNSDCVVVESVVSDSHASDTMKEHSSKQNAPAVAQPVFHYAKEEAIPAAPSSAKSDPSGARKKLQQAISAIEFADFPTAVSLAREAIALLNQ